MLMNSKIEIVIFFGESQWVDDWGRKDSGMGAKSNSKDCSTAIKK